MTWVYVLGIIVVILGFSVFFGAPYVPSRRSDLKKMFDELYPLSKSDLLIDMGSGDGLVLREASRRGATAVGYEISPVLVFLSQFFSRHDPKISIFIANHWKVAFPKETTVVYAFSVERDAGKLKKTIQNQSTSLQKPLTLICYGSPLPNTKAERTFEAYHLYRFYPLQASVA